MNRKHVFRLAGTALLAGGLLVGSIGWAAAQTPPNHGSGDPAQHTSATKAGLTEHGSGEKHGGAGHGAMGGQHTQMQGVVAQALGLTTEEFQAHLQAGKTVPQIAQERGVDLATLRGTVMAQHQASGGHGPGQGHSGGAHGQGHATGRHSQE